MAQRKKLPGKKSKPKNKVHAVSKEKLAERKKQIIERLMQKHGMPKHRAAGVLGALLRETTNLDPTQRQVSVRPETGKAEGFGPGIGIVQHEVGKGKRGNLLFNFAKERGMDPLTIEAQVDFLAEEIKGNVPGSLGKSRFARALKGDTAQEVAQNFTRHGIIPTTTLEANKKQGQGRTRFTEEEVSRGKDAADIFGSIEDGPRAATIMNPATRVDDTYTPPDSILEASGTTEDVFKLDDSILNSRSLQPEDGLL